MLHVPNRTYAAYNSVVCHYTDINTDDKNYTQKEDTTFLASIVTYEFNNDTGEDDGSWFIPINIKYKSIAHKLKGWRHVYIIEDAEDYLQDIYGV